MNIIPETEVAGSFAPSTAIGGDYVGGNKHIYIEANYGNIVIGDSYGENEIKTSISSLRQQITRLIPFEEILLRLMNLRTLSGRRTTREDVLFEDLSALNPFKKKEKGWNLEKVEVSLLGFNVKANSPQKNPGLADNYHEESKEYLTQLNDIEKKMQKLSKGDKNNSNGEVNTDQYSKEEILSDLNILNDKINIQITRLAAFFNQITFSVTEYGGLLSSLVYNIGHKEFKDEAIMHLKIVSTLEKKVKYDEITSPDFNILLSEAVGAIGVMNELEIRRIVIEGLISKDKKRQNQTVLSIIVYIFIAIALLSFGIWGQYLIEYLPKNKIFASVIFWSMIGSFASMVHRFNKNPVYDFGSTVKWLITRPIQGATLGAALYLILISGQYFFTGKTSDFNNNEEIVLFISFLLGFSDRFTESVFNSLIKKYSFEDTNNNTEPTTNASLSTTR
jgi:hypothetical protein